MLSKILLFNRGIFIQSLRNIGWIGLAYFLCLLFSVPLQVLMAYSNLEPSVFQSYLTQQRNVFDISSDFQVLFMMVFPVLIAVFLFRYMQTKLSADFIHSLPLKRSSLFFQYTLYGFLVLFLPVVLTALVLFLVGGITGAGQLFSTGNVFSWLGHTALMNTFVFVAGIFVAVFTGISVLHGALIYILLFFPVGITVLFISNLELFLFGMSSNYYLTQNLDNLIPVVRASNFIHAPLALTELLGYFLIITIAYLTALWVYKQRNIEVATQAIAFRPLRPVFVNGVAFCTMLVGGIYFGQTQNGSIPWIIFGYLTASILGYIIAQMILEKTWRIFDKWKHYLYFALAISLLGFVINFDVTGFETRVPPADSIVRVFYGESVYQMHEEERLADHHFYDGNDITPLLDAYEAPFGRQRYYYETPEVIEHIRQLHLQIIQDRETLEGATNYNIRYRSVAIGYQLDNGKQVLRYYRVPYEQYLPQFEPIIESREYKLNSHPLLRIEDLSTLDSITFNANIINKRLTISNRADLQELHEIIQSELATATIEQVLDNESWATIEYNWGNNRRSHTDWKKSYSQVEDWLADKGYLDQARIVSEDLAYAVIFKNLGSYSQVDGKRTWVSQAITTTTIEEQVTVNFSPEHPEIQESNVIIRSEELPSQYQVYEPVIKITDKDVLDLCLNLARWNDNGDYIIDLYPANAIQPLTFMLNEHQLPSTIKSLFDI